MIGGEKRPSLCSHNNMRQRGDIYPPQSWDRGGKSLQSSGKKVSRVVIFCHSGANNGGDFGADASKRSRSATFALAFSQSSHAFASLAAAAGVVTALGGGLATAGAPLKGVMLFGGGLTAGLPATLLSALPCGDDDRGILFAEAGLLAGGDFAFAPTEDVRGDFGGNARFLAAP